MRVCTPLELLIAPAVQKLKAIATLGWQSYISAACWLRHQQVLQRLSTSSTQFYLTGPIFVGLKYTSGGSLALAMEAHTV